MCVVCLSIILRLCSVCICVCASTQMSQHILVVNTAAKRDSLTYLHVNHTHTHTHTELSFSIYMNFENLYTAVKIRLYCCSVYVMAGLCDFE